MNLRANPESKFLLKYLLIGIGCLAFAAWSVYDGFIKFPGEIPRSEAWQKLESEMKLNPEATQTDKNNRWKEIAKENNWSPKQLGKDEQLSNLKTKIIYQYIFIGLGLAIGLPCLLWYLKAKSSWIESTEDGLRSSSGQELKISQIQKFDKKKWEKKGIGVIHYLEKDGSVEKFIVDDLKYDRKTTDEIVRWVESNIPDDLIVNGSPEKQVERQTENPYSGEENADSP
jgi:hypothetical protein